MRCAAVSKDPANNTHRRITGHSLNLCTPCWRCGEHQLVVVTAGERACQTLRRTSRNHSTGRIGHRHATRLNLNHHLRGEGDMAQIGNQPVRNVDTGRGDAA
jgi:hypothetical protein